MSDDRSKDRQYGAKLINTLTGLKALGEPGSGQPASAALMVKMRRKTLIALQEELDWDVYHRYGLPTDAEAAQVVKSDGNVPDLRPKERFINDKRGKHGPGE